MRTLKMKFITDDGDDFNISLNYASEDLKGEEGPELVNAAVSSVTTNQPFEVQIASCASAELVETTTTVINLTAE